MSSIQGHAGPGAENTYLRYTFFFFNDTATTEIYTLSLHDALPILMFTRKAATSVQSSGLHRRDGTRPSGKRRNGSGSEKTTAGAPTLFTQAERVAAGSGRTASSSAYRAYTPPRPEKAKTNATPHNSQPIRLPCRRETMSVPTLA